MPVFYQEKRIKNLQDFFTGRTFFIRVQCKRKIRTEKKKGRESYDSRPALCCDFFCDRLSLQCRLEIARKNIPRHPSRFGL